MKRNPQDFNDTIPHSTDFSVSSGYDSMPDSMGATNRTRKPAGGLLARALLIVGLGVLAVLAMARWLR
jgi:hypothetical protein